MSDIKKVKHRGRDFCVGDTVWSERHMALGRIERIYMHSIDRDPYAEVNFVPIVGHMPRASDPLNTLRHATQVEIAVHEAKKALGL